MTSTQNITYLLVAMFTLALAGLAVAAPSGHATDHMADRMAAVDTDGDGQISQDEFIAKRTGHFSDADVDGAAGLSFEEFKALQEKRQAERKERRQQQMFNRLDSNDDGVVDEAEFAAKADRMFSRLDADDDGSISAEEMKAHRMARHHGGHMGRHHGHHHGAMPQMPPAPMQ